MSLQVFSWYLQKFNQAEVKSLPRVRRDKEGHHTSLEHNPESTKDRCSPESTLCLIIFLKTLTFRGEHRLQSQKLLAFNRVPRW